MKPIKAGKNTGLDPRKARKTRDLQVGLLKSLRAFSFFPTFCGFTHYLKKKKKLETSDIQKIP